ncbi:MAG: serine/threonine protein kinase [Planctomycetota bacterium]
MPNQNDVESIFYSTMLLGSDTERQAYLDRVCGEQGELRGMVEKLVSAHEQAGDFMSDPKAPPAPEKPGDMIGPYKLLQVIGEGGMGVVYMADQQEPVARRVALKIIKPGMDTGQVIARFEAERQALAVMEHPNIAHVYDAGATASGRPYFAMELVKGVPITQYCDEHGFDPAPCTTRIRRGSSTAT